MCVGPVIITILEGSEWTATNFAKRHDLVNGNGGQKETKLTERKIQVFVYLL